MEKIPYFKELQKVVNEGSFDAYLVGGCVRDLLLGREVHDVDLVCFSHDYKSFASAVRNALPSVWVEFKDNIRLVKGRVEFDISKPRGERLEDDLLKRDFTINNLAMNFEGEIFGDRNDIDCKVIRHVSEQSFTDDPLRLLRTFRFASQLGFELAEDTFAKVKLEKGLIRHSASERVYTELEKLLSGKYGKLAMQSMIDAEFYDEIFPQIEPTCIDIKASDKGIELFMSALYTRADKELRCKLASSLNFPTSLKKSANKTADLAENMIENAGDIVSLKRLIYADPDYFENAVSLMVFLLECDGGTANFISDIEDKVRKSHNDIDFKTPELINGKFLSGLGIENGPDMGIIIKEVRPMLASGELKNIADASSYIIDKYLRG